MLSNFLYSLVKQEIITYLSIFTILQNNFSYLPNIFYKKFREKNFQCNIKVFLTFKYILSFPFLPIFMAQIATNRS